MESMYLEQYPQRLDRYELKTVNKITGQQNVGKYLEADGS